ncbi:MAG: hypothetical protein J6W06_08105 [Bacteroidales bacterium]|nr:hypothetical protein [Bacteroidales bacterium]
MKAIKLLFFSMLCLMALGMNAQRIAVVGFKAGAYVSLSDIDGISETFQNNFNPQGYTLVDRLFVDKTLAEQRIQRSNITEELAVYAGKIMNVSKIVVGKVYKSFDGGYQVEVTVLDVQSEQRMAGDGAEVQPGKYRETITALAKRLAGKIAITPGATVPATPPSSTTPKKRTTVEVLYGYLKIFPNELGTFQAEPTSVISQINAQAQHGYNNWRVPTNEELSLMRANNYVGAGEYMTKESKHGIVLLVSDGKDYASLQAEERKKIEQEYAEIGRQIERQRKAALKAQGYVDLGLPSGTLWKNKNEDGGFYTYEQAVSKFGSKLPTKEQLEELKNSCTWTWTGSGYKVVGPSGASIVLPAAGYRDCRGTVDLVGSGGRYWSSTPKGSDNAWCLIFKSNGVGFDILNDRCYGRSVRLVQD